MTKTPFHLVSLGCPKNLVDSEVMLGLLSRDAYRWVADPAQAEVIIVNTCSFIHDAKEESIATILEMARFKDIGECKALVVTGCLPQRYAAELEKELPEVDLFLGTGDYPRIAQLLNERRATKKTFVSEPLYIHTEKDPRVHSGPFYTAYLKISEGCNRRCAFCAIPEIRGRVRSRTVASLVEEARNLTAQGVRELSLIAQDLTEYGIDTQGRETLETLLTELCKVDGIDWIRLHYAYPDQFSDALIDIIAREPKIVKYLDMPIQHTNDRVLKSMCRGLNKAKLFSVVDKLREKVPGIVFRTSIIVGFPGETEEEFEELKSDLEKLNLDHVGVFTYSKEEGTRAAEMKDQIHPATRRRRFKVLAESLDRLSLGNQQKYLGVTVPVLVEGVSEESDLLLQGRTPGQAREIDGHVLINDIGSFEAPQPGDLVEVTIDEVMPHDLVGRMTGMISRSRRHE